MPVTTEEVRKAFNKLNNNRAAGEDDISGELLKYGPETLVEIITECINDTFTNHSPMDINKGILLSIQKPGKAKGPMQNQRPITLLTTIRKTISLITLNRSRDGTEEYLSHTQSGFRPNRSTADVVWTHRWLAAKTSLEKLDIHITGVDMSSAFDTVNRKQLLQITESFLDEDSNRMIRFLLSDTKLSPLIKGATETREFTSTVGIPQGDGLSPVLFTIYLEAALREVREVIGKDMSPNEIAYADDVDFIKKKEFVDTKKLEPIMKKI